MSSAFKFRLILRDISAVKLWGAWTRSFFVSTLVKRCRRDRGVREALNCFRSTFLRPRRTFLLAVTAAYKNNSDNDNDKPESCDTSITDEELKVLISDLEYVEHLSKNTLYCVRCGKRLIIEKKLPGIHYCGCKQPVLPTEAASEGWQPFMEAEDVVIWRKEYKKGQGLYAYKVYGRYKEVSAADFAAIQVDGAYRKAWDQAVASLSVVEHDANGIPDQALLHWEVLWPRLFANRDYVYLRRHKEYDVKTKPTHNDSITKSLPQKNIPNTPKNMPKEERPSVHSRARLKALEEEENEKKEPERDNPNKVYIIVSKSCESPKVPVTKHAIRVTEYWSHMVVRTLDGENKSGMEYVLTYYDEPAVGGMPAGVQAWASGRAAPTYLQRMRRAANDYGAYLQTHAKLPDSTPTRPEKVSFSSEDEESAVQYNEQDMESSKLGPDLSEESPEKIEDNTKTTEIELKPKHTEDKAVQTLDSRVDDPPGRDQLISKQNGDSEVKQSVVIVVAKDGAVDEMKDNGMEQDGDTETSESQKSDNDKLEEDANNGSGWYKYLYPFYYFV